MWSREHCRISPPCLLAECRKRRLNPVSFVLLCFALFAFSGLRLVSVLSVFLVCLLSCIFQHEPTWMALCSLTVLIAVKSLLPPSQLFTECLLNDKSVYISRYSLRHHASYSLPPCSFWHVAESCSVYVSSECFVLLRELSWWPLTWKNWKSQGV